MTVQQQRIRVLLAQQLMRMKKHPAAIALLVLTLGIAVLVSSSDWLQATPTNKKRPSTVWVVSDRPDEWLNHLEQTVPEELRVEFATRDQVPERDGEAAYPPGDHAIELSWGRQTPQPFVGLDDDLEVRYRFSGSDPATMQPAIHWFWRESATYFGQLPEVFEVSQPMLVRAPASAREKLENTSIMDVLTPGVIATLLLFGVQYFSCTHLFVSFLAQDRERGTLLALALTPTSVGELLTARFLFHLAMSMTVSAFVLAILAPAALLQPLTWLLIVTSSLGFLSVGTLIGSLSRTQNTAGLMTLCYMLVGAIVYYLAARYPLVGLLKMLSFEHYGFPLMFHSVDGQVWSGVAIQLYLRMAALVGFWIALAAAMFRRYGWQ